jgi:hypothetical protein
MKKIERAAEMPNRQGGGGLRGFGRRRVFVDEARHQCVHGNAPLPGLGDEARFSLL